MAFFRASNHSQPKAKPGVPISHGSIPNMSIRDTSGIALFMVIAAISVLAVLVTEFTYISKVNQMIAYGGLDQLSAHYTAKSGFKLSLLRLKAYQQVKTLINAASAAGAGAPPVPKSLLQQIWSFPFIYPLPTSLPGMTLTQKESISKFQKSSNLEGNFSSVIESESSKLNLNAILGTAPGSQPPPLPTASPSPSPSPTTSPSPTASLAAGPFNAEAARQSLEDFLGQLWFNKAQEDPDFGVFYRDFILRDLVDHILTWADRNHERTTAPSMDRVPMKRAPFYSLRELLMLPTMDDEIYQVFAPSLTVNPTPGLNINTITETTLRALIPAMTKDESKEFFKFRDNFTVDNKFRDATGFYNYLKTNVAAFRGNQTYIDELAASFTKRNIRLMVDESEFKITVRAQMNQSTETIEAWVTLSETSPKQAIVPQNPTQPVSQTTGASSTNLPPDIGLRINFMRIL